MANPELLARIQSTQPNPETDLPQAIQRYLNGESIQVLAKEMSISRHTLYRWMMKRSGPAEWRELKQDALIMRIADADAALEAATDPIATSRAREQCRFARMDYERLHSDYSPKQEVTTDNTIRVIIDDRTPLVIPHIDVAPAIITSTPEVIDNQESEEEIK